MRFVAFAMCVCCCVYFFFFFFQAEDGIRDYKVTGVQTCALPISCRRDESGRCPLHRLARGPLFAVFGNHPRHPDTLTSPIAWSHGLTVRGNYGMSSPPSGTCHFSFSPGLSSLSRSTSSTPGGSRRLQGFRRLRPPWTRFELLRSARLQLSYDAPADSITCGCT